MTNTITWFDCPVCGYTARMERANTSVVYCRCVRCGWPNNRTYLLFNNVPASQMLLLVIAVLLALS